MNAIELSMLADQGINVIVLRDDEERPETTMVAAFEEDPDFPVGVASDDYLGPRRSFDGAYLFARYQLSRRGHFGVRGDLVEDPSADGATLHAASGYYEFFPSEFSKLLAGYERVWRQGQAPENRLVVRALEELNAPHTQLVSTGGFLGRRNATLLIGLPQGRESAVLGALQKS